MELKAGILNFWIEILLNIPEIGEHSLMVSALSYLIGEEFFQHKERAFFAGVGGMFHDIGFIVPRFSESLYTIREIYAVLDSMQGEKTPFSVHTTIGGYILSNFLKLSQYSDIAFYHHTPASELDPGEFTHIVANIVGAADIIALHTKKMDLSIAKDVMPDILRMNKQFFFPEVLDVTLNVLSKDYTWWSMEDPQYFFINTVIPSIGRPSGKKTSIEDLIEMGHFTSYVVDTKSPFTRKHSERIALLARDVGKELGLPDSICTELYIAGLFHDTGKLAIDLSILEKPGPLTKSEFWKMRKHVFYTEVFLHHFEKEGYRWPIWASQHHERLDGSGYPKRLTAKDIPLQSRILQVADVFVAFTEERPYRSALSSSLALDAIRKEVEAGRLDTDVFRALERMVKNGYTFPERTMTGEIIDSVKFLLESMEG